MRTLHIGYTRLLFTYLGQQGIDLDSLYGGEQLEKLSSQDGNARRPIEEWDAMVGQAEAVLPDQDVVLGMAASIKPTDLGVLGYLTMASRNVREAAEVFAQFYALLNNAYGLDVLIENGRLVTRMLPLGSERFPRLERLTLGSMCWHSRWLSDRSDLRFDARFAFSSPPSSRMPFYESTFGGKVSFGEDDSCLVRPPGAEALLFSTANHGVQEVLRADLMQRMSDLEEALSSFPQLVEQRIKAGLMKGESRIEDIAASMGMSPRTLQSRLEIHGYSFRSLMNRSRHALALVYLADADIPLVELASMLGFSSQPSFNRAFLRWTGMSPGEYRKARAMDGARIRYG